MELSSCAVRRSGRVRYSNVDIEARVPASHPLRRIRELGSIALAKLDELFTTLYSREGRPARRSADMTVLGKWRIVEMPDYESDFPDMMEPAYILFDMSGSEFPFGCVTGAIHGVVEGDSIEFTWYGNDEMHEACGDGWAELREDGTLEGQICFQGGDEADFIAHPWHSFSRREAGIKLLAGIAGTFPLRNIG